LTQHYLIIFAIAITPTLMPTVITTTFEVQA